MTTLTVERDDVLVITHINATEGHVFSEYDEPLREMFIAEAVLPEGSDGIVCDSDITEWTMDRGDLYRACQREYGRCIGKVFIDKTTGGPPDSVGWCFVSRERYEDTNEPYLRETWVRTAKLNPRYTF